jgi:imidazolonepropionase-like amidohydrolase
VEVAGFAFVDVHVVPLDRKGVLPHRTVQVRDGRIVRIDAAAEAVIPADTVRIDGRGKYLLPGLADMHVHVNDERDLCSSSTASPPFA